MQSFIFALAGRRLYWVQFIIIQYTLGTLYNRGSKKKKRGETICCESSLLHQGCCCPTRTGWERRGHFAASNVLILAAPNWEGLFVHFTYIVLAHSGVAPAFGALLCPFWWGIYLKSRHSCSQSGHGFIHSYVFGKVLTWRSQICTAQLSSSASLIPAPESFIVALCKCIYIGMGLGSFKEGNEVGRLRPTNKWKFL